MVKIEKRNKKCRHELVFEPRWRALFGLALPLGMIFAWLVNCFRAVSINPSLICRNDAFELVLIVRKHCFTHINTTTLSKKFSVFGTKRNLTFRRPKWSFKLLFTDPSHIPIISVRSLTVYRRFLSTNSYTLLTCWSSVDGRAERSKSSTRSRPSLKSFYHL